MLLNKVFSKVAHKNLSYHHPLGWSLHYAVGMMFLIGYHLIFRSMGHTLLNYAVAGFVSGLAGAAIWMITFNLTGILNTAGRKFYYQLVPAHIVFGLGACITLTLLQM